MEKESQHEALIGLVRARLGVVQGGNVVRDDTYLSLEPTVRSLLEHPGWELVMGVVDEARQVLESKLTGPKVLLHEDYIATSRGARALAMCQQVPGVFLHEIARVREMVERRAAAYSGEEE